MLLAGILIVDLPKAAKENKRNMRLAEEIVQALTELPPERFSLKALRWAHLKDQI